MEIEIKKEMNKFKIIMYCIYKEMHKWKTINDIQNNNSNRKVIAHINESY